MKNERALCIIKNDAIVNNQIFTIFNFLENHGFTLHNVKTTFGSKEKILKHYDSLLKNKPFLIESAFNSFDNRELIVFQVEHDSKPVIEYLRQVIGATIPAEADPTSLRGMLSQDTLEDATREKRMINNRIHASDSIENAIREIEIWY